MTVAEIDAPALPARPPARPARAGAAHPRAQRRAGRRPSGPARPAREAHGTAATPGLAAAPPAAGLAGVPAAAGHRGSTPESRSVVLARLAAADGAPVPGGAAGPVPHRTAAARRRGGPPLIRSYSLSGPPGRRPVPDQREAGAARRRQRLSARHVRAGDTLDVAAPRGTFILRGRRRPGPADQRRASARPRCWPCCTRSPPRARPARCGGCTAARERRRAAVRRGDGRACSRRCPTPARTSATAAPARPTRPGATTTRPGRLSARAARAGSASRATRTRTSAGRPRFMHRRHRRPASTSASAAPRSAPEIFGAAAGADARSDRRQPPRRRTRRPAPPGAGPPVSFARSGLTVPWATDYASLLELAEACDVPVRWSCRTGVCHTCETGLLSGDGRLHAGAGRPTRRRQRADLLLATPRGPRPRPLTPCPAACLDSDVG